jgi:hypothetical protein
VVFLVHFVEVVTIDTKVYRFGPFFGQVEKSYLTERSPIVVFDSTSEPAGVVKGGALGLGTVLVLCEDWCGIASLTIFAAIALEVDLDCSEWSGVLRRIVSDVDGCCRDNDKGGKGVKKVRSLHVECGMCVV